MGLEQIFDVNSSWARTLCLLNSGRFHLLPLDVSVHILYSHLVMSNFSDKVKSKKKKSSIKQNNFYCFQEIHAMFILFIQLELL